MRAVEATECRAPCRLRGEQMAFQIGYWLRVDITQPSDDLLLQWDPSDKLPAVWLVEANGLCWVEGGKKGKEKSADIGGEPADLFYMWHQSYAQKRYRVSFSGEPTNWRRVGNVLRIDYDSKKWSGKAEHYVHEVSRGTSLYLADLGQGARLWLCKGKLRATERGLVN